MSLANYSDLKSAVTEWSKRSDLAGNAADFITLAEARLNRKLGVVETNDTITGVVDSRDISVSSLSVVEPISLYLKETGYDDVEIMPQAPGTFPYLTMSGRPAIYSLSEDTITFDRELDQAYSFRFRYRQRFALSDSATTNWLLTNHPDVYLSAVLIWAGVIRREAEQFGTYKGILEEGIEEVAHTISQSKRGILVVDNALANIGRRSHVWDWINQ
jgi:hypothetical protein